MRAREPEEGRTIVQMTTIHAESVSLTRVLNRIDHAGLVRSKPDRQGVGARGASGRRGSGAQADPLRMKIVDLNIILYAVNAKEVGN